MTLDVAYEYMISSLIFFLRTSDDRPYEIAKVSLHVSFYDHTMTLRLSLHIQTNKVTYQLMVWIALF